jgi:hypothetical protein
MIASGAFCDVRPLPHGGLWLRATPTIEKFAGERIQAVFEALAPVLIAGRTKLVGGCDVYRSAAARHIAYTA